MTAPQRRRNEASRSTPRLTKAERKRQLLTHAKQLFVQLGYRETTTEKIAAAAGVTEPVLYRHFRQQKGPVSGSAGGGPRGHAAPLERGDGRASPSRSPSCTPSWTSTSAPRANMPWNSASCTERWSKATMRRSSPCCDRFISTAKRCSRKSSREGQQSGVFRRSLDPRVGAWELIRTALGYTLTLPLGVPLYAEADYLPRAIECLLHACSRRTCDEFTPARC